MISDKILSEIKEFTRLNSEDDDIHGYPHVLRVYNLCIKMGKKLNANLKILEIAALLHDIGRKKEKEDVFKRNHAEISAEIALKFLKNSNLNLTKQEINAIIHCIKSHSFSSGVPAESLEAKILSDADKIDALGAIGLYRTIGFTVLNNGGINDVINHLENKILNLREKLYLKYSKKVAKKRVRIIINFYEQIRQQK